MFLILCFFCWAQTDSGLTKRSPPRLFNAEDYLVDSSISIRSLSPKGRLQFKSFAVPHAA